MDLEDKLLDILGEFGHKLNDDLIKSLDKNGVTGGGGTASKLAGSIKFVFLTGGDEQGIGITMADYWEYVENGRRPGKKPPLDKIIAWIKWKNIQFKPLSQKAKEASIGKKHPIKPKSIEEKIKDMAFAIQAGIAKRGTSNPQGIESNPGFMGPKGTKFATEVLQDGRVDDLTKTLANTMGIEVKINITDALKKLE